MLVLIGIDEAGRGAWAGPLVIGAVALGEPGIDGLTDSKLLTGLEREKLAELIYKNAVNANLGWVTPLEIDRMGLTAATTLGIKRAIKGINQTDCEIIIDGNINYLPKHKNSRCVIKADLTVPPVSAAGIIAKVARDNYMRKLSRKFPVYGFEGHVGYGTKLHSQNLKKHGICEQHRRSFKPIVTFI